MPVAFVTNTTGRSVSRDPGTLQFFFMLLLSYSTQEMKAKAMNDDVVITIWLLMKGCVLLFGTTCTNCCLI